MNVFKIPCGGIGCDKSLVCSNFNDAADNLMLKSLHVFLQLITIPQVQLSSVNVMLTIYNHKSCNVFFTGYLFRSCY